MVTKTKPRPSMRNRAGSELNPRFALSAKVRMKALAILMGRPRADRAKLAMRAHGEKMQAALDRLELLLGGGNFQVARIRTGPLPPHVVSELRPAAKAAAELATLIDSMSGEAKSFVVGTNDFGAAREAKFSSAAEKAKAVKDYADGKAIVVGTYDLAFILSDWAARANSAVDRLGRTEFSKGGGYQKRVVSSVVDEIRKALIEFYKAEAQNQTTALMRAFLKVIPLPK